MIAHTPGRLGLMEYLIWEVVAHESGTFQINLQELGEYMPFGCSEVITATLALNSLGYPTGHFMCICKPAIGLVVAWGDLYAKDGEQGIGWAVVP